MRSNSSGRQSSLLMKRMAHPTMKLLAQKAGMVCIGNKRVSIIGKNSRGEYDKNMDLGKEIDAIRMICVLENGRHPKKKKVWC